MNKREKTLVESGERNCLRLVIFIYLHVHRDKYIWAQFGFSLNIFVDFQTSNTYINGSQ